MFFCLWKGRRACLPAQLLGLLLLLLAPEIEPDIVALYATAQNIAHRRWPTLALAFAVFRPDPVVARAALLPTSPLMRLRVIAVEEAGPLPLPQRALRLDDAALSWLLGHGRPDPLLAPALLPLPPPLLLPAQETLAEGIAKRLAAAAVLKWENLSRGQARRKQLAHEGEDNR